MDSGESTSQNLRTGQRHPHEREFGQELLGKEPVRAVGSSSGSLLSSKSLFHRVLQALWNVKHLVNITEG